MGCCCCCFLDSSCPMASIHVVPIYPITILSGFSSVHDKRPDWLRWSEWMNSIPFSWVKQPQKSLTRVFSVAQERYLSMVFQVHTKNRTALNCNLCCRERNTWTSSANRIWHYQLTGQVGLYTPLDQRKEEGKEGGWSKCLSIGCITSSSNAK